MIYDVYILFMYNWYIGTYKFKLILIFIVLDIMDITLVE